MKITSRTTERGKVRALRPDSPRARAQVHTDTIKPPNFHTHIGRPVLDRDGNEIRIGKGKSTRVRVEYVPIFADAAETARVMVRRAARQAWLDARRARFAPVPRSTGEPMSAHNASKRVRIYWAQNGAPRYTPHQRRRLDQKHAVYLGRAA